MNRVRVTDPVTSQRAANAVGMTLGGLVYETFKEAEGLTDFECYQILNEKYGKKFVVLLGSVSKRRGELVENKLLENTGKTRATGTGREAIIWGVKK